MSERIKELTDKYTAELEADRVKFELLLQEKNRMEAEYEEKLKQAEERHGQQLSTLEAQFQAKLMVEVDRYQSLVQEKERLNEQWDEANAMLMESHEKAIEDLVKEYEARLEEEQMTSERLQQEKTDQENEFKEIRRQASLTLCRVLSTLLCTSSSLGWTGPTRWSFLPWLTE